MNRSRSVPVGKNTPRSRASPSKASIGAVGLHSLEWQHPFVDVFRVFQVQDWLTSDKLGDVSSVLVRIQSQM